MTAVRLTFLDHGRISEWITSTIMLGFALTLILPGDVFAAGQEWGLFRELGVDDAVMAFPLLFIAMARMVGLYANGAWRRSPYVRMIGAIIGAVCFSILSFAFFWPWATGVVQTPSTAVTTYGLLGLFDIIAAYRAGADVRNARAE